MINEVIEVQKYLSGDNIDKANLYQTCYLLAKWFKSKGQTHLQIRMSIYKWANANKITVKPYLNAIIDKALVDEAPLTEGIVVYINERDIKEITKRFDNKNTRLVALAMLCYAKVYANNKGEFSLSSISIGAWVNIHNSNIRRRYIKELINFEYIHRVSTPKNNRKWKNSDEDKNCKYAIRLPLENKGEYMMADNDIERLYKRAFAK